MDKWIEIDVAAVVNNLTQVRTLLDDKTRLIAVVKANAYGHGAVETARILCRNGVDFLAVSYLAEAMQLRKAGIQADILVFAPVASAEEAQQAVQQRLTLTITCEEDRRVLAAACSELQSPLKVHLKVDTGLGRFGMDAAAAVEVGQRIVDHKFLELEGLYTHAADPASPDFTARQFQHFVKIAQSMEKNGILMPIKHMANSAVTLRFPEMYLDAVRIGTLLSGQHPAGRFPIRLQLQDPYRFKSRVITLRTVSRGCTLGYYRSYRLRRDATIAVIPVGFNDGLAVEVANPPADFTDLIKKLVKLVLRYFSWSGLDTNVQIHGANCPVRGKVFMQMALVEIPPGLEVQVGDEVEVPVRKTLAAADITRIYIEDSGGEAT